MKHTSSHRRFSWINASILFDILGIVALILSLALLSRVVQPTVSPVSYTAGDVTGVASLPLHLETPDSHQQLRATFHISVPRFTPHWYSIRASECLTSITIDGNDVSDILPPCRVLGASQRVNLSPFLSSGTHSIVIDITHRAIEHPFYLDLEPSGFDPLFLTIRLFMLIVFCALLYFIASTIRLLSRDSLQHSHVLVMHAPHVVRLFQFGKNPIVILWTGFFVCILTFIAMQPRLLSGYATDSLGQTRVFHNAFKAPHENEETYQLDFTVQYGWLRPVTLRIVPDDCMKDLVINGTRMPDATNEICGYDHGANVDVAHLMHRGLNTVQVSVRNSGGAGSLRVETDLSDPTMSVVIFLLILLGGSALWMTLRRFSSYDHQIITAIIFLGIALRAVYFFATPYHIRANDVDGHIEYAHFILDHGTLPGMRDTWESFQPPLYYLVSAGMMATGRQFYSFGFRDVSMMQAMSPILSILGFLLCIGMIRRCIDSKKYSYEFGVAVLILSVLPGAIYNAGRVNNDVFVQFFIILGLYYLVRSFDRGADRFRFWMYAEIALILGIASKTNALIFAPVLILATPFVFMTKGWKKWLLTLVVILVTTATYLGIYSLRDPDKDNISPTNIVTNSTSLHSALVIPNSRAMFMTFSPVQVFSHPFNDAWGEEGRRSYFLEYLFKSAFFGEWGFDDGMLLIARILVLSGMLCLPLAALGAFCALRKRSPVGILLLLYALCALLLHGVFRYYYPFSPSQDFRYISSIAVSVAALIGYGMTCVPRTLRIAAGTILCIFIGSALIFFVQLI